jgi:hypothetical protein
VHALAITNAGDIYAAGERGLAARLEPNGDNQKREDADARFKGDDDTPKADFTFVGTGPSARGVVARVRPGEGALELLETPRPLTCVASLDRGRLVVAGPAGAFQLVSGSKVTTIEGAPPASLHCLSRVNQLVFAVGAGGAVVWTDGLWCFVERAETTSDLVAVTARSADEGGIWAASKSGRLLRRDGAVWRRIFGEWEGNPHVLAIIAGSKTIRAVTTDGALLEGRRS